MRFVDPLFSRFPQTDGFLQVSGVAGQQVLIEAIAGFSNDEFQFFRSANTRYIPGENVRGQLLQANNVPRSDRSHGQQK